MQLHLLDRSSSQDSSITVKRNKYPYFLKIWHYHPELELVYVLKSTGTRFIGDNIEMFEEGDLVLIGKNLPHMWMNDDNYFEASSKLVAESIAIHFNENFLGREFFSAPEMRSLSRLIRKAERGIKFLSVKKEVINRIEKTLQDDGFERIMGLISILHLLAKHTKYELLASDGYVSSFRKNENRNLDKIYEYIYKNLSSPINLTAVAKIAHMHPSSFSRFFKRTNRKTFSKYINEIRIGYARKLLIENKYNITTICYESGFNNISNFNKQFKAITNRSPSEYLNQHNKVYN